MHARALGATAVLLVSVATAAGAQPKAASGAASEPAPGQVERVVVDVDRLPVNVARIHRGLRQSTVREEFEGFRLKYFVDVYGQSPRLELFTRQDNLVNGPVPYGAPTHGQILEAITPKEYRAPAADFGALIRWLADRKKDK